MMKLFSKFPHIEGFSKSLYTSVNEGLKLSKKDLSEDGYKKVLIAPYIRTMRDNLVVVHDGFMSPVSDPVILSNELYPNYLIDTGFVRAKNYLEVAFVAKTTKAMMRIVENSTCFPVGAFEVNDSVIVVFNIIVLDDLFRDPEIALSDGFTLLPIEVYHPEDYTQGKLAESLVIVKEEGGK